MPIDSIKQRIKAAEFIRKAIQDSKKTKDSGSFLDTFHSFIESIFDRKIDELGLRNIKHGYTPVKGKDYFTKEELTVIENYIKALIPKKGIHYFDGKNGIGIQGERGNDGKPGKNGENVPPETVRMMIEELLKEALPDKPLTEKDLEKLLTNRKFSTKSIPDLEARLNKLRADVMLNYGGHGMSIHKEIVSEVVSGSGTTFTLANLPTLVRGIYAQGQKLSTARSDYTISGKVITTTGTWLAGDIEADYYT